MVGDGINDSAALAQADLSIAMGQGSDIAMDVAKITIMTPDLGKIADAIRLSGGNRAHNPAKPVLGIHLQPDRGAGRRPGCFSRSTGSC